MPSGLSVTPSSKQGRGNKLLHNKIVPIDTDIDDDVVVTISSASDGNLNFQQISSKESKDLYNVFFDSSKTWSSSSIPKDLIFTVKHKRLLTKTDRFIGTCDLSLDEIKGEKETFTVLDLLDENKHVAGVLYVYISKANGNLSIRLHSGRQLKTEQVQEAENSTGSDTDNKLLILSAVLLLIYILTGTLFYSHVDGALGESVDSGSKSERLANAFYFTIVTLTTVGYGDMGATTSGTRLFTTFFVLFGIGFIGVALGIVATKFLDLEENATKALAKALDDVVDDVHDTVKIQVEKVSSQSEKFLRARHKTSRRISDDAAVTERKKEELQSKKSFLETAEGQIFVNVLLLLAIILLGTLFYYVESEEDKSFIDCLYFATISGTTVGYGDESPSSISGRLLGSLYLLISVLTVAKTLGALADLPLSRRRARLKQLVLNRFGHTLSADELSELVQDFGGSNSRCTRSDFVLGMLKRVGTISQNDIDEAASHFDKLDDDSSGVLGASDLTIGAGDLADQVCGLSKDEQVTVLMHRLKEIEDVVDIEMKLLDEEQKKIKHQRDRLHSKIEMINKILHDDETLKKLRQIKDVDMNFFEADYDGPSKPPGVTSSSK